MKTASRALALSVLVIWAAACGKKVDANSAAPTIVLVGPEAITVADLHMLTTGPALSGTLVAERTANIRAEVAGQVMSVLREPGDRVSAGEALARIDDRAIADAWLSARSGVTQAELAADIGARELERAVKLNTAGAIADRDLENTRRANLGAQAQLEDAKARLAQAQKQKDATVVKAPYAGIVADRTVNAGDVVAPGAPLFTVVDPSTMRLEANVPASQLGAIHLGAPVTFAVTGYPDKTFKGSIAHIAPSADAATRQVRVIARIPEPGRRTGGRPVRRRTREQHGARGAHRAAGRHRPARHSPGRGAAQGRARGTRGSDAWRAGRRHRARGTDQWRDPG